MNYYLILYYCQLTGISQEEALNEFQSRNMRISYPPEEYRALFDDRFKIYLENANKLTNIPLSKKCDIPVNVIKDLNHMRDAHNAGLAILLVSRWYRLPTPPGAFVIKLRS